MIGAIDFMKKWKDTCNDHTSCDYCRLRDSCHGGMALLSEQNILSLISLVYGKKGVEVEEITYKKN